MVDRASTFADAGLVALLQRAFVPVAIDQAYERRQQDREGEFYRRFAGQRFSAEGRREDFRNTTQGFYVATAAGELLLYNNNRDPAKVRRLVERALAEFERSEAATADTPAIDPGDADPRYAPEPPDGGLVVRVRARVLGGYPDTDDPYRRAMQQALSRDNLWITAAEHRALVEGRLPDTLARRIARFHLVDNTRGEPPMWQPDELRQVDVELRDGRITGAVHLRTDDAERGYDAQLLGYVETDGERVTRFDVVADGHFEGEGRYTRGAPPGRFPLAIVFSLADGSDVADAIPPQGSRGWLAGYLR